MVNAKKWGLLLAHALVVWAICGAIMFVGMATTTMPFTLTVPAIGAPIVSALMAYLYHRKYGDLPPLNGFSRNLCESRIEFSTT